MNKASIITRFAPSPTGRMHAGNIFAYLCAWLFARKEQGRVLLRIEDLDAARSKPEFADLIRSDFETLGLHWDNEIVYQSHRGDLYCQAYSELETKAVLYPCFCTRADLHAASAPHTGQAPIYPGTCFNLSEEERRARFAQASKDGKAPAKRIHVEQQDITFSDLLQGTQSFNLARECGDFILQRSNGEFAYNLAVVVDDALQGVNLVVRGADLLSSTPQQMYLQHLLGYAQPTYAHVPVLYAPDGHRIAKRNRDASLEDLLARFHSPEGVLGHIAYVAKLIESDKAFSAEELIEVANLSALKGVTSIAWS